MGVGGVVVTGGRDASMLGCKPDLVLVETAVLEAGGESPLFVRGSLRCDTLIILKNNKSCRCDISAPQGLNFPWCRKEFPAASCFFLSTSCRLLFWDFFYPYISPTQHPSPPPTLHFWCISLARFNPVTLTYPDVMARLSSTLRL